MSKRPAVEIHKLCKSFSGFEVLRDIDLTVAKGEVVSVLGFSGSGNSTMLRCINWLEELDSGTIRIAGERIGFNEAKKRKMTNREMAAIRARAGTVFQSFNLWPHLSVVENLMILPVQVKGVSKAEAREEAIRLLEKIGLLEKAEVHPFTLSGGQKQRAAIARALAMSPEVILFDMIVVTHEIDFARAVSDQVVFLGKGLIVEKAPPEKFFGNPDPDRVRKFIERMD